jgi:hypothetical protein
VRLEIATALKRNIRVIPVLVDGASMPRSIELPDNLRPLVRRNALRISDTSFDGDCQRLVATIRQVLEEAATDEQEQKNRLDAERREREEKRRQERGSTEAQRRENERLLKERRDKDQLDAERLEAERRRRLEAEQFEREEKERLEAEQREKRKIEVRECVELVLGVPEHDERPWVQYRLDERDDPETLLTVLTSGEFPKKAEHRAITPPAEPERNPVDCTVFAPDRVERKQTALLQVFLHPLLRRSTTLLIDRELFDRPYQRSNSKIIQGTRLDRSYPEH